MVMVAGIRLRAFVVAVLAPLPFSSLTSSRVRLVVVGGLLSSRKTAQRCLSVRALLKRPRQLCERKLKSVLVPSCLEVVCSSRDVEAIWGDSDAGLMAAQTPSGEGEPKGRG